MVDLFPWACGVVLESEGRFSDDAQDPGGATRYGIDQATARRNGYVGPMAQLPLEVAKAIYRKEYWDAHRCGEMPPSWALAVFDCAVNQGSRAVIWAQQAMGLQQDGVVGTVTLAAMGNAYAADHLRAYLAKRADEYFHDATYAHDGKGWLARLFRVAQAGAAGAPAPVPSRAP